MNHDINYHSDQKWDELLVPPAPLSVSLSLSPAASLSMSLPPSLFLCPLSVVYLSPSLSLSLSLTLSLSLLLSQSLFFHSFPYPNNCFSWLIPSSFSSSSGRKELLAVIMNRAKAVFLLHGANIIGKISFFYWCILHKINKSFQVEELL